MCVNVRACLCAYVCACMCVNVRCVPMCKCACLCACVCVCAITEVPPIVSPSPPFLWTLPLPGCLQELSFHHLSHLDPPPAREEPGPGISEWDPGALRQCVLVAEDKM